MLTASLALIDPSQAKTDGIEIGADAAAAMLAARAGDGRIDVEPFASERRPRQVAPRGAAQRERARPVRDGHAAHPEEPGSVPDRGHARPHERAVRRGVQRGQGIGRSVGIEPDRSPDVDRRVLHGQSALLLQHRPPRHRHGRGVVDERTGPPLRQDEHGGSGRAHQLLEQQEALVTRGDPQTAIREAANDGNPLTEPDANWTSLFADAGLPGRAVRLQLLHGRVLAERPVLLRHRQVCRSR